MPAVPGVLAKYVDAFVDGVSAELQALAGTDHRADVTVDAGELIGAVFDSDGRLSGRRAARRGSTTSGRACNRRC